MKNLTVSKENLKDIVINEALGQIVEIPAINSIDERPKESWELKYEKYLAEIGKAGDVTKLEAQLEFFFFFSHHISNYITSH